MMKWLLVLLTLPVCACVDRDVTSIKPSPSREGQRRVDFEQPLVDILFVIDNSGSMKEEQASLVANFPRFMEVLEEVEGGLPDVHIGVITTGVGGAEQRPCRDGGDGRLQSGSGCPGPLGKSYISTGEANYAGDLQSTFSCMADVGTEGCGFEQPFEAVRLSLSGAAEPGFLRPEALLALVFITDEDDCSVRDLRLVDEQGELGSELGPISSFRCFEFGVVCQPDTPRALGETLGECEPLVDSPYLFDVSDYAEFLIGLKGGTDRVLLSSISGGANGGQAVIEWFDETMTQLAVGASCESEFGSASPAFRLSSLLGAFPKTSSHSICQGDLGPALVEIAKAIKIEIDQSCLVGNIDSDPSTAEVEAQCSVWDVASSGEQQPAMPMCDNADAPTRVPCWVLESNPDKCRDQLSQLELRVVREQPPAGLGWTEIHCSVF